MAWRTVRTSRLWVAIHGVIAACTRIMQAGKKGAKVLWGIISKATIFIGQGLKIIGQGLKIASQVLHPVGSAIAAILELFGKAVEALLSAIGFLLKCLWAVIAFLPKPFRWVGKAVSSVGIAFRHLRAAFVGALITVTMVLLCLAVNNEDVFSSTYFLISSAFSSDRIQFFKLSQQAVWLQVNATPTQATPIDLWATYYFVHQASSIPNGKPLLDRDGHLLGPLLSDSDWCHAAMEGTVQVNDGRGYLTTYNFATRGDTLQVDCTPYFPNLASDITAAVSRSRFLVSTAPFGYGVETIPLVPYRTIAVDRNQIPIGSVLFIPDARGKTITLPSGDRVVHDGFFYAADVGGAIQGSHIDVFLGTAKRNPFSFISSNPNYPFRAYVIHDSDIIQALKSLHK